MFVSFWPDPKAIAVYSYKRLIIHFMDVYASSTLQLITHVLQKVLSGEAIGHFIVSDLLYIL